MRLWCSLLLFFVLTPVARCQTLETPGWSWLEFDTTTYYPQAISTANAIRIRFPQVMVVTKGNSYAIVLGIFKTNVAEKLAIELSREGRLDRITLTSGQYYSRILFGIDPFSNQKEFSIGFPPAPAGLSSLPYIQIASRVDLTQALEIADTYRELGSGTAVFLTKNGWFSVVIDRATNNKTLIQSLKDSKSIPQDSQITTGVGYSELIWRYGTPSDARLLSEFPWLRYRTHEQALANGDGRSAVRLLMNQFVRTGKTDSLLLTKIYMNGRAGIKIDYEIARLWASTCINTNPKCLTALAYMNEQGLGGKKDVKLAIELNRQAADQNDDEAQEVLGISYMLGEGVIQNFSEGLKYLQMSAVAGNASAQSQLSIAYMKGLGTPQDILLSYFWSIVASSNLQAGSFRDDVIRRRNDAMKHLTNAEIIEVQKAAQDWKPKTRPPVFYGASENNTAPASSTDQATEKATIFTGTGFFVSKSGHLVTNAHVVNGCGSVKVITPDGQTNAGDVIVRDVTNDLAVVQTNIQGLGVATIRAGLRLGETISVFGYPFSGLLSSGGNFTVGNITAMSGYGDDSRHVQISAPIQPGNSGGPMIDQSGNVVGIVVAKANALAFASLMKDIPQNINFAIKGSTLQSFLEANNIDFEVGKLGARLAVEEQAELSKRISALIQCARR